MSWIASRRCKLADLDEHVVERYLRHRGGRQSIWPGDQAALRRCLAVLRDEGAIVPASPPSLTPHDQILNEFDAYLRAERGLAPKSIANTVAIKMTHSQLPPRRPSPGAYSFAAGSPPRSIGVLASAIPAWPF